MIKKSTAKINLIVLQDFLKLLFDYSITIVPTFLIALLISAVLAEILPEALFEKVLSSKGFVHIIFASIIGALIPLCTCGMIPLASKLQKKGASWLIVISFLSSGNASSITALFMTLVLGLKITVARFLFSIIFGIVVAYVFIWFFKPTVGAIYTEPIHELSLPKKIIHELFGLIKSFGPWIITAIFIATFIALFLKPEVITSFAGVKNFSSPFLLTLGGFPFYFCAGADIPISKALLSKGAALGSILAFMTASPGVNLTSLLVYQKWLGLKNSIIYLTISFLVCGFMGLVINFVLLPIS